MELDRTNIRKIYKIIAFAVLLFLAVQNLPVIFTAIAWVLDITMPLILGGAIAFIMNVPLTAIEKRLFTNPWPYLDSIRRKGRRAFSLILTMLIFVGIFISMTFLIIPELARSLGALATQIPNFIDSLDSWIKNLVEQYPQLSIVTDNYSFDFDSITKSLTDWLSTIAMDLVQSGFGVVQNIVSKISTFFMGLVLSIYIMAKKESLGRQARAILYALAPESRADTIVRLTQISSKTFSSFISSQVLEAFILGTLTLITNSLFGFPYALLISVIITVLALVPIFGAIIGAAIGMILIAIVNPVQAIFFLVVNIVVQQFENNVIYPRTVGSSIGLPAMWVMIATIVGGNYGGVMGILISIPLLSIVYVLFRTYVYDRLKTLKIPHYKIK